MKRKSEYAIIDGKTGEVVESGPLNASWSAQVCELCAVLRPLKRFKGKRGTIFTDSKYAFGVVHTFGKIWEERGLINTRGRGVVHGEIIKQILEAVREPEAISVVHVKRHQTGIQFWIRGNNLADKEAKSAALLTDIRGLKKELPPYLDDPIGMGEKIEEYLGNADYTWKDWDFLLGILFGSSEKRMILQKARQLWEDEHPQAAGGAGPNAPTVDDTIPQADPQWDPNNQASLARLHDYHAYLIRAIKPGRLESNPSALGAQDIPLASLEPVQGGSEALASTVGSQALETKIQVDANTDLLSMKKELACELLHELDPNKSMDRNTIHPRVLRELAAIIARLLSIIFEKSHRSGDCPGDWKKANITPIYKKGLKEDH
ncbi:hypothetical protein TURU_005378 [Turdus rufiventris]|nr:hypothetical protein TURU_005378 [Turdus rufiventris]